MTEAVAPSASPRNGPAAWASVLWRVLRYAARDAVLAPVLGVLVLVAMVAVLGPVLWRLDPLAVDLASALQPPSGSHPMGTDGNGRDVLSRYIHGSRISLAVGMVVVVAGLVVGGAIGLVAGISHRLIDSALMRVIDALAAFPPLILAMAITVGLGVGLETAVLGVTLSTVPYYARLIRSDVIRIRAQPSVEAAVALGASRSRVVFRHIVPHTTSTMLIQSAAVFGYAILTLAALGFVGLGLQVPEAEWGAMITDGLQYALTGEWWIAVFPGLGVLITVVAANMLADRARDILDPRGPQASVS
ncbi:MAG: ABC transporter permease [Proteobacteria bacterium]|nr:ABC transporter permease [Pseudomonadota bacterium]